MRSLIKFQINTAFIICLAFIFRLLFVNVSLLEEYSTPQANKLLNSHFSTIQKKRSQSQTTFQSDIKGYAAMAVCDEDSDNEEDFVKINSPAILSIFYSFFNRINRSPKLNSLFDSIKCDIFPKKYLSLSILRI